MTAGRLYRYPLINYQCAGGIDLTIRRDSIAARIAVGDALEFARVPSGLTIGDLAHAMRLSPRQYLRIVAGDRRLSFAQAMLATDALGITTAELARLIEQTLGPWDSTAPISYEDARRIHRWRMGQALARLEQEGNEEAGRAREWLERRYGPLEPGGAAESTKGREGARATKKKRKGQEPRSVGKRSIGSSSDSKEHR